MATQADPRYASTPCPIVSTGVAKFISDVLSILEMKLILMRRGWYWYLLSAVVFPVLIFNWTRSMAPEDPEAVRRVMTGTIVFAISLATAGTLAQQMIQDRFQGRLKLLITMPMSKVAYAMGVLTFTSMLATSTVAFLLGFAWAVGVDIDVTWAFFVIAVPVLLSMAGLPLFIVSYAPTAEAGNVMTNLLSSALVLVSPVFFTMERAPLVLKGVGWVSPLRYSADGIAKSLSGQTDIWTEFGVVAAFAMVTIGLGLWKLRWRER